MIQTARVKKIVDGKAVGKSFRVYKVSTYEHVSINKVNEIVTYYELSATGIIDEILISDVSEKYDRIAQPEPKVTIEEKTIEVTMGGQEIKLTHYEYLLKEGYIRKSSAQEIIKGSKGEADARRRAITEELKYLRRYKKMAWEVDKIEALKEERHELQRPRRSHKERKGKKTVSKISYKGRGKGARRVILHI